MIRVVLMLILAVFAFGNGFVSPAFALNETTTNAAVRYGNSCLKVCENRPSGNQAYCVSQKLDSINRRIKGPSYVPIKRIIRQVASQVRRAKTKAAAVEAIQSAKHELLRATGEAKIHYSKFATVMDTAKTVLRH